MKFFNSLRFKIISMFIIVIIPLVAFLYYSNFYSMDVVRNQVAKASNDLLTMHITQVDQILEDTRISLWKMIYEDDSINTLLLHEFGSIDYVIAEAEINNKFIKTYNYNSLLNTLFIYIERDDYVIPVTKGTSNDPGIKADFLRKNMKNLIEYARKTNFQNWQTVEIEGQKGLLKLVGNSQGLYIGTWVSIENIMKPLEGLDIGDGGEIIALSSEGKSLYTGKLNPGLLSSIQTTIKDPEMEYRTITVPDTLQHFLIILKKSEATKVSFVTVIPEKSLLMGLPNLQRTISFIPYIVILMIIMYMLTLQQILLNPIKGLIKAMRKNAQGNLDAKMKEKGANEFKFLIQNFNEMIAQIKGLKIDVYEEKLHVQKAELKHLQAQINPHFLANSLNTIHNLAFLKDYKAIQKMTQYLADYNRFIIRTGKVFITLKEEITHIRNYLEIQKYRFTDNLDFAINVPEEYDACQLPPLTLQPFVENCIIHGYNERNELLKIEITAENSDNKDFYIVCIRDNGVGFPAELLSKLQSGEYQSTASDEHIGIWSVYRRLSMHFGNSAQIIIENGQEKGALVKIWLPKENVQ